MRINAKLLEKAVYSLFVAVGVNADDAQISTDCLMEAELAGIYTHGIAMVPAHIKKCLNGYHINTHLIVEKETASFTVCNANNMIGMVSAWKAMDIAIEKASDSGMHAVFCHNANTFSAAYCYARKAVEAGKIAIVSCNAPSQMAPLGGKEKLLGTNPIAIGIPGEKESPFILDMATSAVAKSKINQAYFNGEKEIPLGWATDCNGLPTNDPKEAIKGLVLPMAGPKGYGLAMAIDVISGLLSHAAFLNQVGRFYSEDNACMNVGHTFIVMDPAMIYGSDFYTKMDDYLKIIRGSQPATDTAVLVPGDINAFSKKKDLELGIDLPKKVVDDLNGLLDAMGKESLTCGI